MPSQGITRKQLHNDVQRKVKVSFPWQTTWKAGEKTLIYLTYGQHIGMPKICTIFSCNITHTCM